MPKYDGKVIIDTRMDTDNVIDGIKAMSSASMRLRNNIKKTQDEIAGVQKEMEELAETKIETEEFAKVRREAEQFEKKLEIMKKTMMKPLPEESIVLRTEKEISALKTEMEKLAETKFESKEFESVEKEIQIIQKKLEESKKKIDKFLEVGGKQGSRALRKLQYDVAQLEQQLMDAEDKKKRLLDNGQAFFMGVDTQKYVQQQEKMDELTAKVEEYCTKIKEKRKIEQDEYAQLANSIDVIKLKMEELQNNGEDYYSATETEKYSKLEKRLSSLTAKLQVYNKQLDESRKKQSGVGDSLKKIGNNAAAFNHKLLNMGISVYLFNTLNKALSSTRTTMVSMLKTDKELVKDLSVIKGNLRTAFQPLYEYVIPGIKMFTSVLRTASGYMAQFTSFLAGKSLAQSKQNAEALYKQAEALEKVGGAAESAGKSLSKYDDLNVASDAVGSGGGSDSGILPEFEDIKVSKELEKWLEGMSERLEPFNESLSSLLSALERFGKGVGSGFIDFLKDSSYFLADVASFLFPPAFDAVANWLNNMDEKDIHDIGYALGILAAAILAYKAGSATMKALAGLKTGLEWFTKHPVITTSLIAFLAVKWANKKATEMLEEFDFDEIRQAAAELFNSEFLGDIFAGWTAIFSDQYNPITHFQEWAEALANPETWQDAFNRVKSYFSGFFTEDMGVEYGELVIAGMGSGMQANLRDIEIGEATIGEWTDAIVAVICDNMATSANWVSDWFTDNIAPWFTKEKWTNILTEAKEGWKTGWGIIFDWWGNLAIVKWFNTSVKPWFKAKKWKESMSGVKEGFEQTFKNSVNAAAAKLNQFINWVNTKLTFTTPEIKVAGKILADSQTITLANIKQIPYLAEGAVIPPNKKFLAVLGDQRNGKNIEAPAALIKQMVKEGISEAKDLGEDMNIYVTVEMDGTIVAKKLVKQNRIHKKRTGVPLFE